MAAVCRTRRMPWSPENVLKSPPSGDSQARERLSVVATRALARCCRHQCSDLSLESSARTVSSQCNQVAAERLQATAHRVRKRDHRSHEGGVAGAALATVASPRPTPSRAEPWRAARSNGLAPGPAPPRSCWSGWSGLRDSSWPLSGSECRRGEVDFSVVRKQLRTLRQIPLTGQLRALYLGVATR